MPISATHQCCQSVLPISASQCRLTVSVSAAYQCCLSVLPISVMYQCVMYQCCLSVPIVMPVNAHQC
ncbi:unnamed protein product, partial [Staurois parvus]